MVMVASRECWWFPHLSWYLNTGLPQWLSGKESAYNAEAAGDMGQEGPLEEGMATHSSILVWSIPWTEEPGRLQPMVSQRVGHD